MYRFSALITFLLLFFSLSFGQDLSEREKERDEMTNAAKYQTESEKCRGLIRAENYAQAEVSCKATVLIAEKLPKTRYIEKHSAYEAVGIALLWQNKPEASITYFNKSMEAARPNIGDTDSEMGLLYYFLGLANYGLDKTEASRSFYTKAENAYRAAFKKIDDDEIRAPYPKAIKSILQAHLMLLKKANLPDEAAKVQNRLDSLKTEFPDFLEN